MTDLSAYETKDALAAAVAEAISEKLRAAIEARGMASFVASGGGTPKPAFELLSQDDRIDWDKVTVTLSDERMAPPEAGVSNADMLREHLLKDAAVSARFLPLDTLSSLEKFDLPFDVVLLGMGGDGHFASIFPDGDGMDAACAPGATILAETIPHPLPPEAPYPRLTLSLPAIRQCRDLFLMISGEGKRDILELAGSDAPEGDLPIRRLLHDPDLPLSIFWAP
ncbi:6-phosphogluconolactonase [Parvularcula marina]|uniref:6-phosphogluconolactonase n=1 Tax=Parvularcula marina TaxID=2292771 RepID=A0A371RI33_9PROT|nr:6-phosphogluconolactonase [Parvularcula marina]RFB05119.1 6-phosphogluconolactonase [Parvularcula marina]